MRYLLMTERHLGHFFAPIESGGSTSGAAGGTSAAARAPERSRHTRYATRLTRVPRHLPQLSDARASARSVCTSTEASHCGHWAIVDFPARVNAEASRPRKGREAPRRSNYWWLA